MKQFLSQSCRPAEYTQKPGCKRRGRDLGSGSALVVDSMATEGDLRMEMQPFFPSHRPRTSNGPGTWHRQSSVSRAWRGSGDSFASPMGAPDHPSAGCGPSPLLCTPSTLPQFIQFCQRSACSTFIFTLASCLPACLNAEQR